MKKTTSFKENAPYRKIVDLLSETSMKHYPRKDSAFKKFESLDFQEYRSKIYDPHELLQKKQKPMQTEMLLWFIFTVIGGLIGSICFALSVAEDYLTEVKIWVMQHFM